MSHHPRRILPPGGSRKRKEREAFYSPKPATSPAKPAVPVSSNKLLAGYLAHEFLTKGTLLGKDFDPARAVAVPLKAGRSREAEPSEKVKPNQDCYAEVANLVKSDGIHIQGIVNPTQLARWIQM